jgi:hypothetical protein
MVPESLVVVYKGQSDDGFVKRFPKWRKMVWQR